MAESLGEFSHKHTGTSFTKNSDGLVVASSHWEGAATGFGAVFGTLSVPLEGGATGGPCTWLGQAFLDDGTWVTGVGDGTWQQVEGEHRWKFSFPAIEISNGDRIRSEGEIDLETRVFAGQLLSVD